jgi:drug/metabolite transporter (DMT)-like permease
MRQPAQSIDSGQPDATTTAATPVAPPQAGDRPILGIALMLASIAVFSAMDGLSKYLTQGYSPVEIAWVRYVVMLLCLVPAIWVAGPRRALATANPGLQVIRGLGMLGSTLLFILSLAHLPIAEATVIGFLSPIMVAAASLPVLGERVGIQRWLAVVAGFLGVMIVVQPGTESFRWAAVYPLLASVSWTLAFVVTRHARGEDSSLVMLGYTGIVGGAITTLALPFVWTWPGPLDWVVMLAAAGCYALAQWLLVLALRFASAATVAPISYSQMVWAGLIGWLAFGAVPDPATVIGSIVIVLSGLFVWQYERRLAERR